LTESGDLMPSTLHFVLFALALVTAIALVAYHASAGLRGRRRLAWEVERAEWRRWIRRP
jgi:hypothetical protein